MLLAATVDLRRGSTELLRISFAYSRVCSVVPRWKIEADALLWQLPELIRDVFVKLRAEAEFAALTVSSVSFFWRSLS